MQVSFFAEVLLGQTPQMEPVGGLIHKVHKFKTRTRLSVDLIEPGSGSVQSRFSPGLDPGFVLEQVLHQPLVLVLIQISLFADPDQVLLELTDLVLERGLLRLQQVALLDAFEAAGLSVAPVLQRAALLLQADHVLLGETAQLPVQLPDRHGHELLVRETVLEPALRERLVEVVSQLVVVVVVLMERVVVFRIRRVPERLIVMWI